MSEINQERVDVERAVRRLLIDYTREMAFTDEDPGAILDRYVQPGFEWCSDGNVMDRDRLVAHAKPARRNALSADVRIEDIVVNESKAAARYVLTSHHRVVGEISIEIFMIGDFAPDGRARRIDQITRTLSGESRRYT